MLIRRAERATTREEILDVDHIINAGLKLWQNMYRSERRHHVARWEPVIRTVIKTTYAANYELMRKENYPNSLFIKNCGLLNGMTQYDEKLPSDVAIKLFRMKVQNPKKYAKYFKDIDDIVIDSLSAARNPIPADVSVLLLSKRLEDNRYESSFRNTDGIIRRSIEAIHGKIPIKIAVMALSIKANYPKTYDQYFREKDEAICAAVNEFLRSSEKR
jgi:hypothetical protein